MISTKALFPLLILLSACGAPVQPAIAPTPKPSAPATSPKPALPSASPSASPAATPQPARAELSVELDFTRLPENERQELSGQELKLTLSSKRLDGPLPEPVAIDDIGETPIVIPPSRPMPRPVYEKTLSFRLGEKPVFRDLPAHEGFMLSFEAPTRIAPSDPESCESTGGQVYAYAAAEVDTRTGPTQITLTALSRGPFNDLVACERTSIRGQVLNEDGKPLAGAKVTIEAIDKPSYFDEIRETESDAEGYYHFYNVYPNLRITITASKTGYQTRSRVEVSGSNKIGDPAVNYYAFRLKR